METTAEEQWKDEDILKILIGKNINYVNELQRKKKLEEENDKRN